MSVWYKLLPSWATGSTPLFPYVALPGISMFYSLKSDANIQTQKPEAANNDNQSQISSISDLTFQQLAA